MIKMADFFLACGGDVLKGSRAVASQVSVLLKRYLTRRCQELNINVDLDSLIDQSHVCRACCKAYTTHQEKEERLYGKTLVSFSSPVSQQQSTLSRPESRQRLPSNNINDDESLLELEHTCKRVCINTEKDTESPPVVVSFCCNLCELIKSIAITCRLVLATAVVAKHIFRLALEGSD